MRARARRDLLAALALFAAGLILVSVAASPLGARFFAGLSPLVSIVFVVGFFVLGLLAMTTALAGAALVVVAWIDDAERIEIQNAADRFFGRPGR